MASLPGMELEAVATPAAALDRVVGSAFDAVLLDPALGDGDDGALALLHRMRTVAPDTVVVIWSDQPTVGFAVRAMRAGALDVLKKTAAAAEIRSVVERAITHGALAREVRRLRGEVARARPGRGDRRVAADAPAPADDRPGRGVRRHRAGRRRERDRQGAPRAHDP